MSSNRVFSSSYSTHATQLAHLVRRRICTYFTGGIEGLSKLVSDLQQRGYKVHDLSVDIRDGVRESSMVCTIMVSSADIDLVLERLRQVPAVVSSELG